MTVSALVTRNDITATASQTSFTYTFRVLEATDMDVYQNGALLASGYTVNNVGDTGGTVDITAGVPNTQIVSLVLAMPLDRTTNYQNSGDFLASDVNADFDKIYIGAIQNENWIDRGLRLQEVEPPTAGVDMTIPLKADRLGKFLAFDSVTGGPIAGSGAAFFDSAAWSVYDFTGDGTTVAFTLGSDPATENNTQVYIDGVYQEKNTYSVAGTVLTFSVAPLNLSTIEVMVIAILPISSTLDQPTRADLVSYTPAGTGAVVTTVQTKLRETVSVKDFGAVGDGVTDDSVAIQAAIDFWVTANKGTLVFDAGVYNTGSTEIVIAFNAGQEVMELYGVGATLSASADIDSGNGYALKITRADSGGSPKILVRNKIITGLKVIASAGDCGGIEVDGRGVSGGWLYRLTFNNVFVESVTKHGWFLTGNFFESQFIACDTNIATNEAGYHGIFIDEDGNDDASGDISSIELVSCVVSGGENNVKLNSAGDSIKIRGGTYLLSGKEAILGSISGNLELNISDIHIENPWEGPSAVLSASWVSTTAQAGIRIIGRGNVTNVYIVSANDTVRQAVMGYATGAMQIQGVTCINNGAVGDFAYVVRAEGTSAGKIFIQSCENLGINGVGLVDTNASANVHYKTILCADESDTETVKSFVSGDATPNVSGGAIFKTAGTTLIQKFDGAKVGKVMTIIATDSITISKGYGFIKLNGNVDFAMTNTDTLTVVFVDNSICYEIGRSVN